MSDNVIWGTDFRAGRDEQPICNAPDEAVIPYHYGGIDRSAGVWKLPPDFPNEYRAPDTGDCA